jgi:phosphoribosylanthranilate isomerase
MSETSIGAPQPGPSPTLVKICGITNREDAHAAIDSGADLLGFIAVQESPRFVAAAAFQRIRDVLPDGFPLVVVAKRAADAAKYHAPIVQYYEESGLDDGLDEGTKRIRVVRIRDEAGLEEARQAQSGVHAILLDSFHVSMLGGSGTTFEWSIAKSLPADIEKPVILAGGLNPKNVPQALTEVRPHAVDVSSGVEDITAGKKNHGLIAEFIAAVRAWDKTEGRDGGPRGRFLD